MELVRKPFRKLKIESLNSFLVDTQQWQIYTNSFFNEDNAVISANGDLELGLSNVLSSPSFTDPAFSGAKVPVEFLSLQKVSKSTMVDFFV